MTVTFGFIEVLTKFVVSPCACFPEKQRSSAQPNLLTAHKSQIHIRTFIRQRLIDSADVPDIIYVIRQKLQTVYSSERKLSDPGNCQTTPRLELSKREISGISD